MKNIKCFGYRLSLLFTILTGSGLMLSCSREEPVTTESQESSPLVIETAYGKVEGETAEGAYRWLGIPFARPPVGDLRWHAPRDPQTWEGVYTAGTMPEPCPQFIPWGDNPGFYGQEDCLYLNVYRPDSNEQNLPVYFWIHGGGNTAGSVRDYAGEVLANKINAVVVMTQYRLGWLGFVTHPALRENAETPEDASGNYGLLDQIKALQWVQENIEHFGGNPSMVTVAGESAGAFNLASLMGAEAVKENNLFHRAIHASGTGASTVSRSVAEGDVRGQALLDALLRNDEGAPELSSTTAQHDYLHSIDDKTLATLFIPGVAGPSLIVDGTVFKTSIQQQLGEGSYHKVPIVLGANKDEMTLFLAGNPKYVDLYQAGRGKTDGTGIQMESEESQAYKRIAEHASRIWVAYGANEFAAQLAQHQGQVFNYAFNWDGDDGSIYQFVYGAAHALDITFFHGDPKSGAFVPFGFNEGNLAGRAALSEAIISYQKQFIRTGSPGNGWDNSSPVTWQAWSNEEGGPKRLVLDADIAQAVISMANQAISAVQVTRDIDAIEDSYIRTAIKGLVAMFEFGRQD